MIQPLAETFSIIEPHFPEPLISPRAHAAIKTLADTLPDAVSSYYLECRLATEAAQIDLLACVEAATGGRERLRRYAERAQGSSESSAHSHWRRVEKFCTHWAKPRSSLHKQVSHIWLEFDGETPRTNLPPPNLLLCLDPDYFDEYARRLPDNHLAARQYRRVTKAALELLLPHQASMLRRKHLFACFDTLPPDGRVVHASVMLSRRPATLKLNITVPKDRLLGYLQYLEWPGSHSELGAVLRDYCSFTGSIKFQVTVDDSISPQIDLEFHFDDNASSLAHLHFLLDRLVSTKLCAPEKRDALLAWPGSFRRTFRRHSWPTRFYKWSDLKIVYRSGLPLEAKGYLGFLPSSSIF